MNSTMKHFLTFLLLTGALGANGQWLTDSLIAHFPMDGTPNDVVGGLVPTVTSGAPSFCPDRFGEPAGAACFDGASFWSYGDVLDMDTSDYSIAAWVKVDTVLPPFDLGPGSWGNEWLVYGGVPFGKGATVYAMPPGAGYSISFRQLTPAVFTANEFTGDDAAISTATIASIVPDTWFHLVISRCGAQHILHVAGVFMDEIETEEARNLNTNIHFAIGAGAREPTPWPNTEFFDGVLDDLRIYKGRCLTTPEILGLSDLNVSIASTRPIDLEFRISPNPAAQNVRIDLPTPLQITGPINALNALGQQVPLRAGNLTMVNDAVKSISVDVSQLPEGAYFVVVPTEKGRMHGRFIKE
ncbi:MAG TPA: T9SS type A sorting domain-containing protein [Flavobacteriales bacterium]|jgi:hypothetical protein|nr:T9SS type A sorting domain-containing protein [Flavobacteriales bacterium]HOZ40851.1 T9SS type A sorting domain-containing protein [Flavobacteriales bacterium]